MFSDRFSLRRLDCSDFADFDMTSGVLGAFLWTLDDMVVTFARPLLSL